MPNTSGQLLTITPPADASTATGLREEAQPQEAGMLSGGLALDVAGVVWEATESADTRCWGLLPDKIQVMRLELPAGTPFAARADS